jgi:hypothetical protein
MANVRRRKAPEERIAMSTGDETESETGRQVGDDATAVLAVHQAWFYGATQPRSGRALAERCANFASGRHEHPRMYNTNEQIYETIDDMKQLWLGFGEHLITDACHDVVEPVVTVYGDVALLTCDQCAMDIRPVAGSSPQVADQSELPGVEPGKTTRFLFRATEFMRRDDGAGQPRWTIWHCHYSLTGTETYDNLS